MFSFDTKREPEKCIALRGVTFCLFSACKDAPLGQRQGGVFRLPPPYLWTPPTPQRVKGCNALTILKKWSKHKKLKLRQFGVKIFNWFFRLRRFKALSRCATAPGEQARPQTLRFNRKLSRHAKGAPLGELLSAAKLRGYPIKTSIPRFLPVENSLRLCYDRKQRIFPKIDSEEGNGSCVKVVF